LGNLITWLKGDGDVVGAAFGDIKSSALPAMDPPPLHSEYFLILVCLLDLFQMTFDGF